MFGVESGAVRQAPWHPRSASNRFTFNGKEAQTVGADFANGGSSGGSGAWSALGSLPILDYGARMLILRGFPQFTGPDPSAEVAPNWGTYAFCFANPVRYRDPDGKFPIETIWDAFNVASGVESFVQNVKAGNVGGAVVDGLGVAFDAAATVLPFVPGGASAVIKAVRGVDRAVNAANVVDNVGDAAKTAENAGDGVKMWENAGKAIGPIGDAGGNVMKQLPEAMQRSSKTTRKGDGTIFTDPINPRGNNVRTMSGKPDSPNPAQQKPYVKETRDGKSIDIGGNPTASDAPEAHISKDEYKFNR